MKIPAICHRIWFGADQSWLVKQCLESHDILRAAGFEMRIWNESSPEICDVIRGLLKERKYAFAADLLRYKLLRRYGGIYLDTDVEVVRDFTPLLTRSFIGEELPRRANTAVLGTTPDHPFVQAMIDRTTELFGKRVFPAAPVVASEVLGAGTFDVAVYPPHFFYPYNPFGGAPQLLLRNVSSETYAIHHWNHGWRRSFLERVRSKLFELSSRPDTRSSRIEKVESSGSG